MIYDSHLWRKGLLKSADRLRAFQSLKRYREESFDITEREIFLGFFAVRKLMEAKSKVSISLTNFRLNGNRHRSLKPMGSYERFEFFEYYELEKSVQLQFSLTYLANQFVHSLLFQFDFDQFGTPSGVFFVSDKDREKFCNHISLDQIVLAFETVVGSQPERFKVQLAKDGGRDLVSID